MILQIAVGFALASLAAIAGTAFYARGIVRPLTVITSAAEEMSRGKLSTRAEVTGVNCVKCDRFLDPVVFDRRHIVGQIAEGKARKTAGVGREHRRGQYARLNAAG
jgi:hypothetical protein